MINKQKWTRIALIAAAAATAAGLLMMGLGIVTGAQKWIQVTKNGVEIVDTTPHTESNPSLAAFTAIDMQVPGANVQLKKGDTFGIELTTYGNTEALSYSVQNDTLTVTGEENEDIWKFLNLNLTFQYNNNLVVVYLPEGADFEKVSIQNRSGSTEIDALHVKDLSVVCSYGSLTMQDVTAVKTDIDMKNGSCNVSGLSTASLAYQNEYGKGTFQNVSQESGGTMQFTAGNGSLKLQDVTAGTLQFANTYGSTTLKDVTADAVSGESKHGGLKISASSLGNVQLRSGYGSIHATGLETTGLDVVNKNGSTELQGSFAGKNTLQATYGRVQFETSLPKESYFLSLESKYGSIHVDGEDYSENVHTIDGTYENSLQIYASNGSVNAWFGS